MNNEFLLSPIRQSLRSGSLQAIEYQLDRILKKARESTCTPQFKTEIHLESVKAFRALNRQNQAAQLCDIALANIPPDSFQLLAALKRLRALLYLDEENYAAAQIAVEAADGLELMLQENLTVVNRRDEEVTVETWLVTTEISLAQGLIIEAQQYFDKAVTRLSSEEATLRRRRISPFERKKIEQYYHDLSQMLQLYGLTLSLVTGDAQARLHLSELCAAIGKENEIAISQKRLPNVPLHQKLLSLLGKNATAEGISASEARRWSLFGSKDFLKVGGKIISPAASPDLSPPAFSSLVSLPDSQVSLLANDDAESEIASATAKVLERSTAALEKMAAIFARLESVLPEFAQHFNGTAPADFTPRGFSGHLLDTDFFNFLHQVHQLRFTGYIQFTWANNLYEKAIIKGLLPELLREGVAYLYIVEGFVIDAVFKGQTTTNTLETAQNNFVLITRICLSLSVDGIQPDIIGKAVPEPLVEARSRLLKLRDQDIFFLTAELEEIAAGERSELSFFNAPTDQEDADFDRLNFDGENIIENSSPPLSAAGQLPEAKKPRTPEETAAFETEENLLEIAN